MGETVDPSGMEFDEFLEHFGVKGMHWGVRRERTPEQSRQAELKKVNRKIDRVDADKALNGIMLRGSAAKKLNKKMARKDPTWGTKKLSPAEELEFRKRASRKVVRDTFLIGTAETTALLVGGNLVIKSLASSPSALRGAQISGLILAGNMARYRLGELSELHEANKLDDLKLRRDQLSKASTVNKTKTERR